MPSRLTTVVGMSSSAVELKPLAEEVRVTRDELVVRLFDGRTITVPIVWFPRLARATEEERANLKLLGSGPGIHWPEGSLTSCPRSIIAPRSSVVNSALPFVCRSTCSRKSESRRFGSRSTTASTKARASDRFRSTVLSPNSCRSSSPSWRRGSPIPMRASSMVSYRRRRPRSHRPPPRRR